MNKIQIIIVVITISMSCLSFANHQESFIQNYSDLSINESRFSGIPASIIMAQAIHESAWGNSRLAANGNNFFGIKCKNNWDGGVIFHKDDDKNKNGQIIQSCFRSYDNPSQSFEDHSLFLLNNSRYSTLFSHPKTDYKSWAKGLQKQGYATNTKYAEVIITLIEKYKLYTLDQPSNIEIEAYAVNSNNQTATVTPTAFVLPPDYKPNYFSGMRSKGIENKRRELFSTKED